MGAGDHGHGAADTLPELPVVVAGAAGGAAHSQPPSTVVTLSVEEMGRFFARAPHDQDTESWNVRLDAALREILARANDFVPSEWGGILLDDPRATRAGSPAPRLTFIAVFGPDAPQVLGRRVASDAGFAGLVYRGGQPQGTEHLAPDDPLMGALPKRTAGHPIRSVVGVPLAVGGVTCGMLHLANRRSGTGYGERDRDLLRLFAAYAGSSIQNAIDALRATTLARHDHLTELYNSRYLHSRLQEEIGRADDEGLDLSLLFLDLDHFKVVNDHFGHQAGSWILREVARLLAEHAPPASVLARYGGDEFVAILPGTGLGRACQTAEDLRGAISRATLFDVERESDEPTLAPLGVRASVGVASYRDHLAPGGTQRRRANLLLRLADAAMYRAKAAGRDRVEVADAEE